MISAIIIPLFSDVMDGLHVGGMVVLLTCLVALNFVMFALCNNCYYDVYL